MKEIILVFVLLLSMVTWPATPASAASGTVTPNGDSSVNWAVLGGTNDNSCSGGTHCDRVDEGSTPATSDYVGTGTSGSGGEIEEFAMSTIGSVDTVSSITLYMYAQSATNANGGTLDNVEMTIFIAGAYQTASVKTPAFNSWGWHSATFTGTWTQANLDGLQAQLKRTVQGGGQTASRDDDVRIASVYADITYTSAVTFAQSAYRWYQNADSVQPGSVLANENTAASSAGLTTPVRLRQALTVTGDLSASSQAFKLQYATSTSGPWSDVGTSSGDWYDQSWQNRKKIAFDNLDQAESLANFPVLVKLTSSNIDYSKTKDAGEDIRFTDSNGTTLLKHEIEKWDEAGTSFVWVKVPQIDGFSGTDYIYMYYNNASASDSQDPTNVWDSNFQGVWHMKEASGATIDDASVNNRNGTKQSSTEPNPISGQAGNGQDFDGSNDNVNIGDSIDLSPNSAMTVSAWVNVDNAPVSQGFIMSKYSPGIGGEWYLSVDSNRLVGFLRECGSYGTLSNTALTLDTWYNVTAVYTGSVIYIYLNGAFHKQVTDSCSITASGVDTIIGAGDNGAGVTNALDGLIDEVRVSNSARSGDWLAAEYKSMTGLFNSFGSEETRTGSWGFKNNPTPADGTAITTALLSGTPVNQSYEENNPTVSNPNAVSSGQKAEWDFALDPTNAILNTAYYFRMVKSDGTALGTYSVYPQITITAGSNTAPSNPSSLAQKKTDDTVITTGSWVNSTDIKFTATVSDPDSSDTLQLCVEKDLLGTSFSNTEDLCGTGAAYSGSGVSASVTITGITDASEYHWQARVKDAGGLYSSWVSYDVNAESARDFAIDTTAPTGGTAYDGTEAGVDKAFSDTSLSSLSANWSGFTFDVSGISKYEYSIGTTAGGTDVKTWTDNSTTTSVTATGLTLQTSKVYYVNVRATDNAGNATVRSSNGQLVAPSVSFSVSPATITFDNLNAASSYTNTQTTTLTTSTNAYGGYVVRAFASDYLRSAGNFTMADFNGGSYASPDSWQSGDTGLGYTSSDTNVQGVNKFQNNPCPGGNALAAPGCYAPFSQTKPGDIVADHTANVTGAPIANQSFTITLRTTATALQQAARYQTVLVYAITPIY